MPISIAFSLALPHPDKLSNIGCYRRNFGTDTSIQSLACNRSSKRMLNWAPMTADLPLSATRILPTRTRSTPIRGAGSADGDLPLKRGDEFAARELGATAGLAAAQFSSQCKLSLSQRHGRL